MIENFTHVNKTYEQARYDRLVDSIHEYLCDDEVGSKRFLQDLEKGCLELRGHYDNIIDNFTHIQDFFK